VVKKRGVGGLFGDESNPQWDLGRRCIVLYLAGSKAVRTDLLDHVRYKGSVEYGVTRRLQRQTLRTTLSRSKERGTLYTAYARTVPG
jgi:hypothetical protein